MKQWKAFRVKHGTNKLPMNIISTSSICFLKTNLCWLQTTIVVTRRGSGGSGVIPCTRTSDGGGAQFPYVNSNEAFN